MQMDQLAGTTIGQYKLIELVDVKSNAYIYRTYEASLQREVAVKLFVGDFLQSPYFVERFMREMQVIALLEHSRILPIYAFGSQENIIYTVTRYVTGGSLEQRLEQRRNRLPSIQETTDLISQLASALDYAHSRDILHGDIRLDNIIFDHSGNAYLSDFGIARLLSVGLGDAIIGSPAYMAPEQVQGEPLSPASDQYALAIVAFELLSGQLPFEAETPFALALKQVTEIPPAIHTIRDDLPPEMSSVFNKALSKDPTDRFANLSDFVNEFRRASEGGNFTSTDTDLYTFRLERKPVSVNRGMSYDYPATTSIPQSASSAKKSNITLLAFVLSFLIVGGVIFAVLSASAGIVPRITVTPARTGTPTQIPVATLTPIPDYFPMPINGNPFQPY